jgi:hypothetical protein
MKERSIGQASIWFLQKMDSNPKIKRAAIGAEGGRVACIEYDPLTPVIRTTVGGAV